MHQWESDLLVPFLNGQSKAVSWTKSQANKSFDVSVRVAHTEIVASLFIEVLHLS